MSYTDSNIFRQFYLTYPYILQAVPEEYIRSIGQPLADQFGKDKDIQTALLILFQNFTFTHFTEMIKIKDPLKRAFYEQQAIKGNWGSRELKRQIESLLLERTGFSRDKSALLEAVRNNQDNLKCRRNHSRPLCAGIHRI